MKFTIYRYKKNNIDQTRFILGKSIMEKYGFVDGQLLKIRIKEFNFVSKVNIIKNLNKDGSICKNGQITIPKNIADSLNLRNKQEIDIYF